MALNTKKNQLKFKKTLFSLVLVLIYSFTFFINKETVTSLNPTPGSIIITADKPHQFTKDTIFSEDVFFEAGSIIKIADSVDLVFKGNVTVAGTKNSRVTFKPIDKKWGHLRFNSNKKTAHIFNYTSLHNGKILFEEKAKVELQNVMFKHTAQLKYWDGLFVMRFGTLKADSITMLGNNSGEGIVVSSLDTATVTNSHFQKINDAVEFLHCHNGSVENCFFEGNNHDDGIDLNGCQNIIIQNNIFKNIHDRCLEIGLHSYYKNPSLNIIVLNNHFEKSKIAIQVKEGTEMYAGYNTIENCKYAVEISDSASVLKMYNSLIFHTTSRLILTKDTLYNLEWSACISDSILTPPNNCNTQSKSEMSHCNLKASKLSKLLKIDSSKVGIQEKHLTIDIKQVSQLK
jgi:hypothetical protein